MTLTTVGAERDPPIPGLGLETPEDLFSSLTDLLVLRPPEPRVASRPLPNMSFLRHHYFALVCNLTAIGGATYYIQKEIADWQCFALGEQEEQMEKLEKSIKDHLFSSQTQYVSVFLS